MVEAIPEKVAGIEIISPEFVGQRLIRYGRNEFHNTVRGINPDFERCATPSPETGRFIDPEDMAQRKRVCFIGDVLGRGSLRRRAEPVGRTVFIDGVPFTVVGVMRKKTQNSNYNGQRDERCAFIPWTTYAALYGNKYVSNIIFQPADLGRTKARDGGRQEAPGEARRLLSRRPGRPGRLGHARVREAVHGSSSWPSPSSWASSARSPCSSAASAWPPIMRVVVEERTREIGHQAGRRGPAPDHPAAVLRRVV